MKFNKMLEQNNMESSETPVLESEPSFRRRLNSSNESYTGYEIIQESKSLSPKINNNSNNSIINNINDYYLFPNGKTMINNEPSPFIKSNKSILSTNQSITDNDIYLQSFPPFLSSNSNLNNNSNHTNYTPLNINNINSANNNNNNNNNKNNIHIIDKGITVEFQGRTMHGSSVARIRWLKNRKSQVLGFCLCIALLGITISFYSKRWMGLINGSILSIICGIAVIFTYNKKKNWHQHPNPIVHMRSILGIFLAICFLCNIFINYTINTDNNDCRTLSGFTEFFFFTSEAWGLVMACDLFFSLTSPFSSYKRMMKYYHFWVWLFGTIMALFMWSHQNAAGYFRVDGQPIPSDEVSSNLIGFCLASSQKCCSSEFDRKTGEKCLEPSCNDSNFMKAQQWFQFYLTINIYNIRPWIFVYSFVIFVLIISLAVLLLAWHRLYLRGVPKTYNIRLRVLNYISFFTGAYVFYWLLLLLVYMSAYFVSTREDEESTLSGTTVTYNYELHITALVLRQIAAFIISARGYLDYVIWFAVNSIDSAPSNADRNLDNNDLDVDLSPQVNTALRSEILYYTTFGIKLAVKEVSSNNNQEDFLINSNGENAESTRTKSGKNIKFSSYCPLIFKQLRQFFGIKDEEYMNMFSATTKERFSEGRSGAFMFYTADEMLIVKTMSYSECELLRKMAEKYKNYLINNKYDSLLTRFYGCHAVTLYGKTYHFVVMGNLFADTGIIHQRYDIKGSWIDRNATLPQRGDKAHCRYCNASYTYGSTMNQECSNNNNNINFNLNFHEPNIVLKDNDLLTKIRITNDSARLLYKQLCNDSNFLRQQGIMDYSLLMGIQSCEYFVDFHSNQNITTLNNTVGSSILRTKAASSISGPALYHFGIIDFLQEWNINKKLENFYKSKILRKDLEGISALPPKEYLDRFQRKMAQIFAINNNYDINNDINIIDTGQIIKESNNNNMINNNDINNSSQMNLLDVIDGQNLLFVNGNLNENKAILTDTNHLEM